MPRRASRLCTALAARRITRPPSRPCLPPTLQRRGQSREVHGFGWLVVRTRSITSTGASSLDAGVSDTSEIRPVGVPKLAVVSHTVPPSTGGQAMLIYRLFADYDPAR